MSKPENNLEKALVENGDFDPDKAKEVKEKAVGAFEAAMRKVERCYWVYMCLCFWLALFSWFHFWHAITTKALLFYGILMLIFFETTILMKLWYWIMNSKIGVLKAVKQLELGGPAVDDADLGKRARGSDGPRMGLSRRERTIWYVVLVAGLFLVSYVKTEGDTYWSPSSGASLTSEGCVTLAADGSGLAVTEMSLVYQVETPDSFDFAAPKEAVLRFTDSRGRELPFTTSPQDGRVRYDVSLGRHVFSGHRFSYTREQESPECATEDDGLWTYSTYYSYGYNTNELAETVVLPDGAEIVSVNPWPVTQFTLMGKPTLRFVATRGSKEPFEYTIQYRLPEETSE